jgi:regulator of nonsense transcripts 1
MSKKKGPVLKNAFDEFLLNPTIMKSAFEMDKIAAALNLDFGLDINNAKDLLSTVNASRDSLQAIMGALGGETTLVEPAVKRLFNNERRSKDSLRIAALQAWAACRASTLPDVVPRLARVKTINTATLERQVGDFSASLATLGS